MQIIILDSLFLSGMHMLGDNSRHSRKGLHIKSPSLELAPWEYNVGLVNGYRWMEKPFFLAKIN